MWLWEAQDAMRATADLSSNTPPLALLASNLGTHNTWA